MLAGPGFAGLWALPMAKKGAPSKSTRVPWIAAEAVKAAAGKVYRWFTQTGENLFALFVAARMPIFTDTVRTFPAAGRPPAASPEQGFREGVFRGPFPACLSHAVLGRSDLFARGPCCGGRSQRALLPATTKGFISTHDVEEVRKKFNETQLGDMVNDPVMKPFIEDVKKQIGAKLERAGKKLGLKWADMEGVYGGEVAAASFSPTRKTRCRTRPC